MLLGDRDMTHYSVERCETVLIAHMIRGLEVVLQSSGVVFTDNAAAAAAELCGLVREPKGRGKDGGITIRSRARGRQVLSLFLGHGVRHHKSNVNARKSLGKGKAKGCARERYEEQDQWGLWVGSKEKGRVDE